MPRERAAIAIRELKAAPLQVEHDKDLERKREQRSKAAEIYIPPIVDLKRREKCLDDPERFLLTYGKPDEDKPAEIQDGRFWMPFARHHLSMIDAIYSRAVSGGDKAVAAPRGDGKSTVVFWMLIFILCACLRRHPCGIGQTNAKAKLKLFDPIVREFTWNPYLYEDFPEICHPLRELDGAPARSRKQHVNGVKTRIQADQTHLRLPIVEGYPLGYGGSTLDYYGFDSDIRGSRHDFAAIDDPEKREVAFSQPSGSRKAQHQVIEDLIDSDVAGLAFPNSTIPRVVITTIQNRRCYSYRVTSRDVKEGGKPSFEGDRHGILVSWPDNREIWDEYIALRQTGQAEGDKDGESAYEFYLANREEMERGVEVSNPERYDHNNAFEISAVQAFFNRVADWGLPRVMAELQNNPEEEEVEETLGITPGLVATRISGLKQNILPSYPDVKIALGCDIGNWVCHWVKVAVFGNAIGVVIDEGEFHTKNMVKNPSQAYLTKALIEALHAFRTNMMAENPPDWALIDSGDGRHTEAVYEFVRQVRGNPWAASKGWDSKRFSMPPVDEHGNNKDSTKRNFWECWAHYQAAEKLWLYHVHTQAIKHWVQERFMTPTFDENQQFNDGSLSLFVPREKKRWLEFSNHMCTEGLERLFNPGKGKTEVTWKEYSTKNHKLDAIALAMAAAGVNGMRLIKRVSLPPAKPAQNRKSNQHSNSNSRFKHRPGGWVQGAKGRKP